MFFGVLAAVFIGGCFFQYPDVVDATVTVTTEHPPVWMVARGSGKIKEVYRTDRDSVYAGDLIAVLENPARTADVWELKEQLRAFRLTDSCVQAARFPDRPALGSIQAAYAAFLRSLTDYRNYLELNLYDRQIEATEEELAEYGNYIAHLERQVVLDGRQTEIAETVHRREKGLYEDGLTAKAEYEEAQQALLAKQQGTEQLMTSLSNARIQQAARLAVLIQPHQRRPDGSNPQIHPKSIVVPPRHKNLRTVPV